MSIKSKLLYLLLAGILLLQACSMSQVTPTPGPTQTLVPPTPTQPLPTPTVPPFEPLHLGEVWPTGDNKIVGISVATDGTIYAIDYKGVLHAWDTSQNELWTYRGDYQEASSPYLSKSLIYIFTDDGDLVALDFDGKEAWTFPMPGRVKSAPVISPDGSVYLETYDHSSTDFKSDVYHLNADGTYEKFKLEFLQNLERALVDVKGNLYLWGFGGLTIFSPSGEMIKDCEGKGGTGLSSNLVFRSDGVLLYVSSNSYLLGKKPDCSMLDKSVPLGGKKDDRPLYHLFSGSDDILYIGGSDGTLYAMDSKNMSLLWKSEAHPEIGKIASMVVLEDGLIYVVTSQAKMAVFDSSGKMKWSGELHSPNVPNDLYVLPTNDLILFHGNQILLYTKDLSLQYTFPAGAELPATEEQACEEIVSFVLDFIVKYEIGETADYIRNTDMPWVDAPPDANIIIYGPALTSEDSFSYVNDKNPITVWWFADDQLSEVDDKLKVIEEYRANHMENPQSDIFAWGYYEFAITKVSEDFRTAEVYIGVSCGSLCGHGVMYKIQRSPSGEWWIYDATDLWVS